MIICFDSVHPLWKLHISFNQKPNKCPKGQQLRNQVAVRLIFIQWTTCATPHPKFYSLCLKIYYSPDIQQYRDHNRCGTHYGIFEVVVSDIVSSNFGKRKVFCILSFTTPLNLQTVHIYNQLQKITSYLTVFFQEDFLPGCEKEFKRIAETLNSLVWPCQ